MKVKFNEDLNDPIFAYSIKDLKRLELVGTNTLIENVSTNKWQKGDLVIVSFKQVFNLQAGVYSLSLGCTKYSVDGTLEVFHRLYDVLFIEVIATDHFFGLYRIDSEIKLERIN